MDEINLKRVIANTVNKSLLDYLQKKASNHKCYKIYSDIERIKYWLDSKYLYLSDGRNWNDKKDKSTFNPPHSKCKRFGLCTSFSKSENVAMWMLYSGMNNKGAMLNIGNRQMKKIISSAKCVTLGYFDNDFIPKLRIQSEKPNIYCQDIIYVSDNENGSYTIKRSDERIEIKNLALLDDIATKKAYPWSYENECRLIVDIPDYNSVTKGMSKDDKERCDTIAIMIPEDINTELKKQVYRSPNFKDKCEELQLLDSKLGSTLSWNLCNNCKK